MARNDGIDRTSARNVDVPDKDIGNTQNHNEREKDSYRNPDIIPERLSYNVHFKKPSASYTELFAQMESSGTISTRGLKPDAIHYTRVYKPEGRDAFPVLIQRSCYPDQMPIYEVYAKELVKRGYGYVVQVCRGTGQSEGEWEPNVNERADGLATLQWLNDQPWAESIGYFGASYLALTGWAIADAVPEKVKGMMLTVYGTDRFASAYEKGLFRHDVLTGWAMANAGHPVKADYLESCRYRPHAKVDEALWEGRLEWYQDWIHATRRSDPYWQQGWWKQLQDIPGRTKVPVYIVDAWYDHHFGSAMNTYQSLDPDTRAHSWLDIGCWNHMSAPCIEWGEQRNLRNGDVKRVLEWFDLLLKQKKQPQARIRAYVMGEDRWSELPCWPAPVADTKRLYLTAEGGLTAAPQQPGAACFDYDPFQPCPTHGAESVLTTITEAGSKLQPKPGYRPDVLSFLSEPLTEALPICGKIRVHLQVATDVMLYAEHEIERIGRIAFETAMKRRKKMPDQKIGVFDQAE